MHPYEIVVDSTSDLSRSVRRKYGIYDDYMHGVIYLPDEKEIRADLDNEQFTQHDYYALIKKRAGGVRSAFPTQEEIRRVLLPLAKAHIPAIIMAMSSAISGSYNAFLTGAGLLKADYPEWRYAVIDTLKYGGGVALLAIYAALNRDEGMSFDDDVLWLEEARYRLHESGPMDDLRYLAKVGRVSAPKAFFGQLAGVQPLADFTIKGENVPLGTVRGSDHVDDVAMRYMEETIVDPASQIIIVGHSDREERALKYQKMVMELFKPKECLILPVSLSTGANVGPGLCTCFYLGERLSDDRSREDLIFQRVSKK